MALDLLLLCIAFAGHIALGVGLFNQMHSAWLAPKWVHPLERAVMLLTALMPVGVLACLLAMPPSARGAGPILPSLLGAAPWSWLWLYLAPCGLFGVLAASRWMWNQLQHKPPRELLAIRSIRTETWKSSTAEPLVRGVAGWVARLPGNEALQIRIEEKRFALSRWPSALSPFRIAHLSDLHISGRTGRAYFRRAIELVNEQSPEMVIISGDICESDQCLAWLDDFGALAAPFGSFFVLGNHDLRVSKSGEIRNRLAAAGLIDLGGRWIVHTPRGIPMILAGNELPWFAPAAPMERCPQEIDGARPVRIVVSHSPDQFLWARSFDADLMLAGHTHGGQIRLPCVGPLIAPSRYGVKYASGEFFEPPTLMHVSRGLSSLQPVRFGCPPEITILIVESPVERLSNSRTSSSVASPPPSIPPPARAASAASPPALLP